MTYFRNSFLPFFNTKPLRFVPHHPTTIKEIKRQQIENAKNKYAKKETKSNFKRLNNVFNSNDSPNTFFLCKVEMNGKNFR